MSIPLFFGKYPFPALRLSSTMANRQGRSLGLFSPGLPPLASYGTTFPCLLTHHFCLKLLGPKGKSNAFCFVGKRDVCSQLACVLMSFTTRSAYPFCDISPAHILQRVTPALTFLLKYNNLGRDFWMPTLVAREAKMV